MVPKRPYIVVWMVGKNYPVMKKPSDTFPKQLRDSTSIMWQLVVYGAEEELVLVFVVMYVLGNQPRIFGRQGRESITGNLLHLNNSKLQDPSKSLLILKLTHKKVVTAKH
jgi:hypothetical protein